MTVVAMGCRVGEFLYDPKAGRPAELRNAIRTVAQEVEGYIQTISSGFGRDQYRRLFVTLTYAANTKGDPHDVSDCLKCVREWLRRLGYPMCPYGWVAESQERGALHYHLMLWWPRRLLLPKLDRRGWWPHGMTKVETAKNPVGYMVKYATKFKDDVRKFRKGTRLYGYGGLPLEAREAVRRRRMARWMRQAVDTVRDAEFMEGVEREIEQQERAREAFERWAFPEDYPPGPDDAPPWVLEDEERAELDTREADQQERDDVLRRLAWRGWSRFSRCVGGFVDKLSGELTPTPWAAEFTNGILRVWLKETVA